MCSASEEEEGGSAALNCGTRRKRREIKFKALFLSELMSVFVEVEWNILGGWEGGGVPGCSRSHEACSGNKPWAERRAGWGGEKVETLLSAGGSLVWKEDGLCAPSSYQCAPLWTREDRGQEAISYCMVSYHYFFGQWNLRKLCSSGAPKHSHNSYTEGYQPADGSEAIPRSADLCSWEIEACVSVWGCLCLCLCGYIAWHVTGERPQTH